MHSIKKAILLASLATTSSWAAAQELVSMPKSYHFRYAITSHFADSGQKRYGMFEIAEGAGKIQMILKYDNQSPIVFLFDGSKSWVQTSPLQYFIRTGFSYADYIIPIYFPFQFSAQKVFYSIDDGLALIHKTRNTLTANSDISDIDYLILRDQNKGKPILDGAKIVQSMTSAGKEQTILIGRSKYPRIKLRFVVKPSSTPSFTPNQIVINQYNQILNADNTISSSSGNTHELRLVKYDESSEILSPESFIAKGSALQFETDQPNFAFTYDPSSGSLQSQIFNAKDARRRFDLEHTEKKTSSSLIWIPMYLSILFGILALTLTIYSRKKKVSSS